MVHRIFSVEFFCVETRHAINIDFSRLYCVKSQHRGYINGEICWGFYPAKSGSCASTVLVMVQVYKSTLGFVWALGLQKMLYCKRVTVTPAAAPSRAIDMSGLSPGGTSSLVPAGTSTVLSTW